jgi:hypothetical protein
VVGGSNLNLAKEQRFMAKETKKQNGKKQTGNNGSKHWKTLRIRNIGDDTGPRDLFELFSGTGFEVSDSAVESIGRPDRYQLEGFIDVARDDADDALRWLQDQVWRGQLLDVQIVSKR